MLLTLQIIPPLAEVGLHLKYNFNNIHYPPVKKSNLIVHKSFDTNVAIMKLFPGINRNFVEAVINTKGLKGLIIETFGSGNAPTYKWFLDDLKDFITEGEELFLMSLSVMEEVWRWDYMRQAVRCWPPVW